ncbi:MAG TPA: ABC transporter permease [Candidatus Acidoferrum sp.]|jgi:predicted permease
MMTGMQTSWQTFRFAVRMLRKSPGFAAAAVLTLALGIGSNIAIFSVVDGVLLKPLPYPHSEQLVAVSHTAPGINLTNLGVSPSMYFIYREQSRVFEDVGIYVDDSVNITGLEAPEHIRALDVTDGVLPILGIPPVLGRWFTPANDLPGSPDTVMLTYGYWRRKFDGDRSVIGRMLDVDGKPREIIGVLPERFRFLDEPEPALILPIKLDRTTTVLGDFGFQGIARLKPGATVAQSNVDVARMLPIVARSFSAPPRYSLKAYEDARVGPDLRPLKQAVVGDVGKVLWVLMGGIGLVLLIACANVANLLLVRVEARRQELAIRAALGATRRRIATQLWSESFVLSLIGSALGLGFAYGGQQLLVAMAPSSLPRLNEIGIGGPVLLFSFGAALVASLLFGSMPVLKYAGVRLETRLREASRSLSAGRERQRARSALVIVQVALALVLLISSGLMIRTFRALIHAEAGFTAPNAVQTFQISMPPAEISKDEQVTQMQQVILHNLEAISGVQSAGLSTSIPMNGSLAFGLLLVEDQTSTTGRIPPARWFNFVSPGFLKTLGAPLLAGRDLTWTDIQNKIPVVLVSENLARELWLDPANALGKRIRTGANDPWSEIIGVVNDIHYDGINKPAPKSVYWPIVMNHFAGRDGFTARYVTFGIRTPRAGSEDFMKGVRQAVWSVDPNLPLADVHTLGYFYGKSMTRTSFTLVMLACAGSVALLLGIVGLYGVLSYSVSQRTREIGIRVAMGAQSLEVMRLVVGHGLKLVLIGIATGLAAALGLTRLMASLLYGVSPTDPLTFTGVAILLALSALAACYIPARRAMRTDPMVSLRSE